MQQLTACVCQQQPKPAPCCPWSPPSLQVTYPMHIILRYEIERGLLDGSIAVDDVPAVWNAKMKEYLGVVPENDAKGCLQVGAPVASCAPEWPCDQPSMC